MSEDVREVPPHRKRMSTLAKPWALQIKCPPEGSGIMNWNPFPDWTTIRRYRTEADAEKALATQQRGRKAKLWESRIVGPED